MRASTICTLIHRAFSSLCNGANITAGVGLSIGLIDFSIGGGRGYECDEYFHVTIDYITLYMYSLLVWFVLFHRKYVPRGYVATTI
jgi:hypothetical protein